MTLLNVVLVTASSMAQRDQCVKLVVVSVLVRRILAGRRVESALMVIGTSLIASVSLTVNLILCAALDKVKICEIQRSIRLLYQLHFEISVTFYCEF